MMKRLAFLVPLVLAGSALADAPAPKPAPKQAAASRVEILVTNRGFEPETINVAAKKETTLVFTRKTEKTCTKSVVVKMDDGKKIERELPLDKPVEIAVTFPKAGKLGYACSMDMNKGVIVVQ